MNLYTLKDIYKEGILVISEGEEVLMRVPLFPGI